MNIIKLYKRITEKAHSFVRKRGLFLLLCGVFLCYLNSAFGSSVFKSIPDSAAIPVESATIIIRDIIIEGNAITKDNIIERELMFAKGDTLSFSDFENLKEQSKTNLQNTLLFNFVTINTSLVPGDYSEATVTIKVTEQWYVWPTPIIEINDRNLNSWIAHHDYSRLNYGFKVYWENFRGRMENLNLLVRFGTTRRVNFSYDIPYINKQRHFGIGFGLNYDHNQEVGFATYDDHLQFLTGTGYLKESFSAALHLHYRPGIHVIHDLNLGYGTQSFSDTLLILNPGYTSSMISKMRYPEIYYRLRCDYRDDKNYPLNGWYYEMIYYHNGWRAIQSKAPSIDWLKFSLRKYTPLSQKFFTGITADGKLSAGNRQPYVFQSGLGYGGDYVRGYEYYVVDGQQYGLVKTNLYYSLLPQTNFTIPYIKSEKFSKSHISLYLNAFFDLGYVWDRQWKQEDNNNLPNSLLWGSGLGLDLITYYDRVFRFEYSINKKGEVGFFIHYMTTL